MPIHVACPNCREEFDLPDKLGGKQVRCKACQTIFRVAGEGVQKPAAVRAARKAVPELERADDDDYAPPPRKSKTWLYLLIGGGAACLLLCVACSAVGALLYSLPSKAPVPVAVNPVPNPSVDTRPMTPVDTKPATP